jgi:hypothetical protein
MANMVRLAVLVVGLFLTLKLWGLQGAFVALIGAPLVAYFALTPGIAKHMPGALRVELASLVVLIAGAALATASAWYITPFSMN